MAMAAMESQQQMYGGKVFEAIGKPFSIQIDLAWFIGKRQRPSSSLVVLWPQYARRPCCIRD
jgi:hypothetical protein